MGYISEILREAPPDLKFLSDIDFIDINRFDPEYFEVGLEKLLRVLHATPPKVKSATSITQKIISVETTTKSLLGPVETTTTSNTVDVTTTIGKGADFNLADATLVGIAEPRVVHKYANSSSSTSVVCGPNLPNLGKSSSTSTPPRAGDR